MEFWPLSELICSFIISCPVPHPQYNPCLFFHLAYWFHKVLSCLALQLRRVTSISAHHGRHWLLGEKEKSGHSKSLPALLSWVCCHHLIPCYLMPALQSQQGFPGRMKRLAFCYLLQWYKRRRKALLCLRNVASLVAEGHRWACSEGVLNQIYFGAAPGLFWLSVRPLSPREFTREEKQWHTASFYTHSSPFPIKLDWDAEPGGYIPWWPFCSF